MTIASTDSRKSYAGDGTTTLFSTSPVVFFDATDLTVYIITTATGAIDQTLTLNTHYTVSGGNGAVGSVNLAAGSSPFGAPASGKTLLIVRVIPLTQASDFVNNDGSDAEVAERALDRAVVRDQQIDEVQDRTIKLSVVETATAALTELPFDRASKVLAFDASKNLIAQANVPTSGVAATPFMETVLDDATAAAARATLGFTDATAKGDIPTATAAGQYGRKAVGSNGDVLVPSSGATDGLAWIGQGAHLFNGTFSVSVAANALTIAIKTDGGANPSNADPVFAAMPNATGGFAVYAITAATSLTISSGSTLGTVSGQAHRVYFGLADDSGTLRLWARNPWDNTNKALSGVVDGLSYSSTAEGGAGAADSAHVFYSATAFTSKLVRALGYFESTQATAGTWAASPSKVKVLSPGDKRTGDVVQTTHFFTGASATGTTAIPDDDTIPQNTEGNEYMTLGITPSSAVNLLQIESGANLSHSAQSLTVGIALFQDSIADALCAMRLNTGDNTQLNSVHLMWLMLAGGTAATTFKIRAGSSTGATTTFNGKSGARTWGGALASYIRVTELFA